MSEKLFDFSRLNNPQGPGFVMEDYTREQALASVGPGWAGIVGDLWDFLKAQDPPVYINQVKEKFGGLRCYVGGTMPEQTDAVYKRIGEAEATSFKVCETCGEPGVLRGPGWYFTACDEHADGKAPVGEEDEGFEDGEAGDDGSRGKEQERYMDDELGGGDDVE